MIILLFYIILYTILLIVSFVEGVEGVESVIRLCPMILIVSSFMRYSYCNSCEID